MTPSSPAGKAAAELARRIRAKTADEDPEFLAQRFIADLMGHGWRLTEAQAPRPEFDPLHRRQGTPDASKHAAQIRAQLANRDGGGAA